MGIWKFTNYHVYLDLFISIMIWWFCHIYFINTCFRKWWLSYNIERYMKRPPHVFISMLSAFSVILLTLNRLHIMYICYVTLSKNRCNSKWQKVYKSCEHWYCEYYECSLCSFLPFCNYVLLSLKRNVNLL